MSLVEMDITVQASSPSPYDGRYYWLIPAVGVTRGSQGTDCFEGLRSQMLDAISRRWEQTGRVHAGILATAHSNRALGRILRAVGFVALPADEFSMVRYLPI